MDYNKINEFLHSRRRGVFSSIEYERELPTKKDFKDLKITKRTSSVVRFGVEYNNIGTVQQKRENGQLPSTPQPLQWGEWKQYPYFIEHKGNTYLRATKATNAHPHIHYYINGVETDESIVKQYCLKSAFSKNDSEVFTLKINDIKAIH